MTEPRAQMDSQTTRNSDFDVVPMETEVVIVGGGIIGACTALELARRGIPVVLCEKGTIGEEQSSRNWGWVRKMGRDIREMPLMIHAMKLWDELPTVIGADPGFRRAIADYLHREREAVGEEIEFLREVGPFRRG